MTAIIIFLFSLTITIISMPYFIQFFKQKKLGQITREEGPLWHEVKSGTPTMGGTVFLLSIIVTILITGLIYNYLNIDAWVILCTFLFFGSIGSADDFISIFQQKNEGLTARQKFLLQAIFSIILVMISAYQNVIWRIPFFGLSFEHIVLTMIFSFLWITGFSNAVNLTDGLDGLATGTSIIAYATYAFIAFKDGNIPVMLSAIAAVGSLVGFLYFNFKPAKIFMGDVGSLAIGAGLAVISLILNRPWSLLFIGFIFVIETLSVILQVTSFKLTGKRIFKMSPIHHHFEMVGWSEKRIVYTFWTIGLLTSFIYLFFAL